MIKKQHSIITGGSSGIGKATAKLLASLGNNITIISRDINKLEAAKQEIKSVCISPEQKVLALAADVSDRLSIESAIFTAIEQISPPDILITSAGIAHPDYFQNLSIDVFEQTMAVNYFGTLYCIKAVLPVMEKRKKGHIVMLSSGAGLMGIYGYSAYSSSKFAIRGLAESLRGELKLLGINLSLVYPPDTDTPQLEQENKTKPPETKAITATAKTWTAEAVGQEIIKGIKRNSFMITPGSEMSILAKIHSLAFPLINQYFDQTVAKVRKNL
ncbi:short-chain dehydrogenase [Aphanothece hegewaldii CCALA 016]|uniref:3-dehydrosphinganine reductase n=1 Tax=Aphanothece hegewaldii CCALA 016 TaxID=2107694 RepID=A0A2T1LVG2_9CHRO|nr:SDR family oxidoreductase [Aphanothece hegewaldii]PSF35718.1 short-chain dehydrogenase [Aphanothece hegewaldii CCALA 016]